MKLGLIARCEVARGIAIQSRNFYDHMPVERVLLVRMPNPHTVEAPHWYRNVTDAAYDMRHHQLDEETVKGWLDGLDVVFTVETPNDWRIPTWCRELGVRLVVQANPEFVRHNLPGFEDLPHPDQWWWPTTWRLEHLPAGSVMPVPMDLHFHRRSDDDRLHLLHVIGKQAFQDRNGTDLLIQALRSVRAKIKLTVHSIEGAVNEFTRNRDVEIDLRLHPVEDQWSMYDDQDILIVPRRYGGLCLPAIEAAASGMLVAMPDCSPNQELAALLIPGAYRRQLNLACGRVGSFDASVHEMGSMINRWASSRDVGELRERQARLVPTWDEWGPRYLRAFETL